MRLLEHGKHLCLCCLAVSRLEIDDTSASVSAAACPDRVMGRSELRVSISSCHYSRDGFGRLP